MSDTPLKPLKPLAELLARPGSATAELKRRAEAAMDFADALRAGLAPELAGALRGANVQPDGTLVVMASSPAWAARLRFEETTLLSLGRQRQPGISRVKVRVSGAAG